MNEVRHLFLQACLPAHINFNLLSQREDFIFLPTREAMIDMLLILLSCVMNCESVVIFRTQPAVAFAVQVANTDNQVDDSHISMGFHVYAKLRVFTADGRWDNNPKVARWFF